MVEVLVTAILVFSMGKKAIQNWGLLEIIRIVCMEKTVILQVTGKTGGEL